MSKHSKVRTYTRRPLSLIAQIVSHAYDHGNKSASEKFGVANAQICMWKHALPRWLEDEENRLKQDEMQLREPELHRLFTLWLEQMKEKEALEAAGNIRYIDDDKEPSAAE